MKPAVHKTLKWLNWTLILPLLVVVLLLAILLYTPAGLKLGLWLSHKYVPQLSVAGHNGSLLGGMQLNNVRWQNDSSAFQLDQLQLDIDNGCFFQFKLCVSKLALSNGTVTLGENTFRFDRFNTSVEAWGRELQVNNSQLQQLQIELAATTEPSPEPFSYKPPALSDISLPLAIYVNGFSLTDASIIQEQQKTPLPDVSFSVQAREQSIRLLDLQASHPQARLSATADITLKGNYPLNARLSAVLKEEPLAEQQLNVSLSGSLADLAATIRASGKIEASGEAQLAVLSAGLPLSVDLQYEAFSWPLEGDDSWQLSRGNLSATGDLQQLKFTVKAGVSHRTVPAIVLNAAGQYLLTDSVLSVDSAQVSTLDGTIAGNARIELADTLRWQAALKLSRIKPGSFWPEFNGEINGKLANTGTFSQDGSWQTELSQLAIDGRLKDEIINIQGKLAASFRQPVNRYKLDSEQLILQHGDNRISLSGSLAEQWQLDAQVSVPDLSSSLPSTQGVINADIPLRGAQRQPQLTATIAASDLRYAGNSLQQLALDLQLQVQQNQQLQATLDLTASDGSLQGFQIDKFSLTLSGNEAQHQLELALQSTRSDISFAVNGQLTDRKRWQGQLSDATVGSPIGPWQLQDVIDLGYAHQPQQLNISQHCWRNDPGSLCLTDNASLSAENLAATVELQQLNLASLNALMPLAVNLSGELNASVSANWQPGQRPRLDLSVQSNHGALTERSSPPISLSWQQLTLSSQLANDQLTTSVQATLNEQAGLTARLNIADISSNNRPLSGSLQLTDFTLEFLQPLLDEYSELAGVISADIAAEGTVQNPLLSGQLALNKLRVKGKLAPTDINNGSLRVAFKGAQADLQGDIVTPQGALTLAGKADWQQIDNWQARLGVKGDPLSIQIEQGKLQVKPDLDISANPQQIKLTGSIAIPSAQLSIDELPQNAVGLSGDTVILNAEGKPVKEQQAMATPITADIRLQLGDKVQLDAFGLETLLRGNLQVRQQQGKQTINGEVRLVDGTFRSYGQDLLIRSGKMTFSGPPDQPYLNVEAIRNPANMEDSVVAGIRVTGPADKPQITIFSEPAMPQANALSYLLVGRDLDSESGSAANAVTTSLIGMSIASSGSLVGEIGEAFGVSDLTLDTAGSGDNSQVTVSGYLTRDLQVKYGIGIFEPIGEFTLRYRLMQSLYLEAVSGLDNAVDLLYRFEFD
ncbi:MAG: hypothetical protein CML20_07385 [Rheinheimera sp.]|nr:hypothetical protein [Rheinheimera sp.]